MKRKTKIIILLIILIIMLLVSGILIKLFVFPSVEFKLKGNKSYTLNYGEEYKDKGVVAKINDKDYSKKVKVNKKSLDLSKVGKYEIIYELELPLGKKQKLTRIINVVDTVSPVIELINGNSLTLDYGVAYTEYGYNISDNYDKTENLKVNITYDREIDPYTSGTYIVNYEVVDTSGNFSNAIREVIVKPYERIKVIDGVTYVDGVLIANKKYGLPSTYNPGINGEAYNQLVAMQSAASALGHSIPLVSGFRSYYSQQTIYNNYVSIYGVEQTDTFSARPGHSEHQTGLAFDVGAIDDSMGEWPNGIWLAENAHKYGFIIRYPQGKQHITGYKYEPWHIRYLGVDLATRVYQSGLTLEEYLGI